MEKMWWFERINGISEHVLGSRSPAASVLFYYFLSHFSRPLWSRSPNNLSPRMSEWRTISGYRLFWFPFERTIGQTTSVWPTISDAMVRRRCPDTDLDSFAIASVRLAERRRPMKAPFTTFRIRMRNSINLLFYEFVCLVEIFAEARFCSHFMSDKLKSSHRRNQMNDFPSLRISQHSHSHSLKMKKKNRFSFDPRAGGLWCWHRHWIIWRNGFSLRMHFT